MLVITFTRPDRLRSSRAIRVNSSNGFFYPRAAPFKSHLAGHHLGFNMNRFLGALLFLAASLCLSNSVSATPRCSPDAVIQARKLLSFHSDGVDRTEIIPEAKELSPIVNPADNKQKFQVLEVWGYIYKASYRMRLIYYRLDKDCVLMGQEVLEIAKR